MGYDPYFIHTARFASIHMPTFLPEVAPLREFVVSFV